MQYKTTIGLETHVELKTKTKMFCDCLNDPNETKPNVNVCPICMGHPGTLPVINREAVRNVVKTGLALKSLSMPISLITISPLKRLALILPWVLRDRPSKAILVKRPEAVPDNSLDQKPARIGRKSKVRRFREVSISGVAE